MTLVTIRKATTIILMTGVMALLCSCGSDSTPPGSASVPPALDTPTDSSTGLAPASELQSNCLNWPEQDISRSNSARLMTSLAEGEPAVDFALQDVDGTTHTLSDLLKTKPVLLVLGGFT
jgi:hypothetical protein